MLNSNPTALALSGSKNEKQGLEDVLAVGCEVTEIRTSYKMGWERSEKVPTGARSSAHLRDCIKGVLAKDFLFFHTKKWCTWSTKLKYMIHKKDVHGPQGGFSCLNKMI